MSPRILGILLLCASQLGAQELIQPASVTSSTAGTDYFSVEHLIDGSGLGGVPTVSNYAGLTHQAASASTAWVTTDPGADYFATNAPSPVLTVSFGGEIYNLTDFVVWGYHFGTPNNNEAKNFTLEFSSDGGQTFGNSVNLVHSRTASASDTLSLGTTISADTVRITITDNHRDNPGAGGGDRVGLGELRFIGELVPNLSPVLSVSRALDFGSFASDPGPVTVNLGVTNSGIQEALQISSASIRTGIGDSSFFNVTGAPLSVGFGETDTLAVTFSGGSEGCLFAILDIASNDPDYPNVTVILTASVNCSPSPPEPPVFSIPSGTFSGIQSVALTTISPDSLIVYTRDGSLPSLENGTVYEEVPISLTSTQQIRAAAIKPGQAAAIASESYVRLASNLQSYQSELPILVVENFGAGTIPNKGWSTNTQTGAGLVQPDRQSAAMLVMDRDENRNLASITAVPDDRSRIGIRVRGAFSSTWTPKPYSVETWKKDSDEDRKVSLLGMPSESDWILYFPHPTYDRTMINNAFIWELGKTTGRYGTRFRFVDVFVNEDGGDLTLADRQGVYLLAEKVKRDPQRIDYEALSEDGSTGGWLHSINRMDAIPSSGYPTENGAMSPQFFHTAGPNRIQETAPNTAGLGDDIPRQYNAYINFEDPNGYRINTAQRATVEDWFRDFEDVFYDDSSWLDPANGYRSYLDTRDFIDYAHLLTLGKQGDGLLISIFPWVSSGERKLHMGPMWDFNNGAFHGSTTGDLFFRTDRLWYPRLLDDPAYLREHIDRWFELRRGPFSNQAMADLVDEISAQFPDSLVSGQGIALSTWQTRITDMKTWLETRANWLDAQWLAPPSLTLNTNTVSISHPQNGGLYYTTDGSDPADSPTAILFQFPFTLTASAEIRTRMQTSVGEWSALNEATYRIGTPANATNIVISEIMYNPAGAETEFIEIQNISATETVDLTNSNFTIGIQYDFPVGSTLTPGERMVIMQAEFQNDTRLTNGGEQIVLSAEDGSIIRDFTYLDRAPWPESADGEGFSLILKAPATNPDHSVATNWRRSSQAGGNPGTSDSLPYTPGSDLLAYALTNPKNFRVDVSDQIEFSLPINPAAEEAAVIVEESADLVSWAPVQGLTYNSVTEDSEIWQTTQATSASYFRLKITLTP